ncbi:MAG TPA: glycosyltransferase [Thermoanaerobaculia bacterium]|jgi:glycosyltransferase involved in cell wall biosynthesis|nr:glycosyltransferase [Thermoanaerobaculia bacterium]
MHILLMQSSRSRLLAQRRVRSYVARYGVPDLIHAHGSMWGGYAAMLCARDLRRPYVITEDAESILTLDISRGDRRRIVDVYRQAKRVIAVSDALKASIDCIAGAQIAEVVPNTVDSEYFHLPCAPRQSRPFVFLSVSDLSPSKRVDLSIRAFARLHASEPHARLVVIGSGKESSRLRELTHTLGVPDVIEFTGAIPRAAVRQRMWDANALVLSSDVETFGVALIEALSTGLPVIATRCGGPEEIVTPDLGTLVECNDAAGLARAMGDMLRRDFDAAELRSSVTRRFGYAEVGKRLCEIYESLLPAGEGAAKRRMRGEQSRESRPSPGASRHPLPVGEGAAS